LNKYVIPLIILTIVCIVTMSMSKNVSIEVEGVINNSHFNIYNNSIKLVESVINNEHKNIIDGIGEIKSDIFVLESTFRIYEASYFLGEGKLDVYWKLLSSYRLYLDEIEIEISKESITHKDLLLIKSEVNEMIIILETITNNKNNRFSKRIINIEDQVSSFGLSDNNHIFQYYESLPDE